MRSPKRSAHSNTYKTQSLGLFNLDMHGSLTDSFNMTPRQLSFASIKRHQTSVMASTSTTLGRTIMPSEEYLVAHQRSDSAFGRNSGLELTNIDFDSIYKYPQFQTPQGESRVSFKGGSATTRRVKKFEVLTSVDETTRAGESPMKYGHGEPVTVKDGKDENFLMTMQGENSLFQVSH